MAEKNVEKLAELFHENSQFVHMGGYWGKQQELETIRTGGIWYKKAEVHDVQMKFAAGTATIYNRIHLNSVVGGNAVRFPFIVTEVNHLNSSCASCDRWGRLRYLCLCCRRKK